MIGVAALTGFVGLYWARRKRPPSDFLAASQTVGPRLNATAISGEYLSAASFLGIAGLILLEGADALWYPVGFTAGYVALLLFVAAPLRRSGAYSLPDFAEARLGSVSLRRICTVFVLLIGWLYLVPQLRGAGLTLATVTGLPVWVGAAVVMVIVTFNVVTGWMHSITFVYAVQYWVKLTALAFPVFVLLILLPGESADFRGSLGDPAPPYFATDTVVSVETAAVLEVSEPTLFEATGNVDGMLVDGPVYWAPGAHQVQADTELRFAADTRTPVVSGAPLRNDDWLRLNSAGPLSLLTTYSLLVALLLGTMGLPHVLGRYYANPDGRAARATTLVVLILLGAFYLVPTLSGVLSRLYVPQLLVAGKTDAAVLLLPLAALDNSWPAYLFGGLIAAGAFAAFISAASGLVMSVTGVLSTDVLPRRLRNFRAATLVTWTVPLAFALAVSALSLAQSVGLAFAVAASTFCPLLVLGIWWRRLTDVGAAAGMVVGGGLAFLAVLPAALGILPAGWHDILAQPALFTVPLAFAAMILVSRATADRTPPDVSLILLRMHAPERLGFSRNQDVSRPGMPGNPGRRVGKHRREP